MIFSYNWLKDYVRKLPEAQRLAELLTMHSFEVVEVHPVKSSKTGQFNGVKKIGKDWILDIDVLPNRAPDCFSYLGIARECSALTNSKFQTPNSKQIPNSKFQTKDFVSVEVGDKQACPRYTAKVVTEVKVGPSPKWLKERIEICGLNSINNIVDIANYVMLETGQPLHAFDGQKLKGKKIIVRFARKGEKITTLDNQKFNLGPGILVIADSENPLAIAGIKGGKGPEVSKKTETVVLESANFNPRIIRKGSRNLNLKTDASIRFEHGLDPNLTEFAINRAAYLIQEIAGGKVAKGLVDVYPKKVYPKRIKLDLDYLESLLGVKIPLREIRKILEKLGFKIKKQPYGESAKRRPVKLKILDVEVPTFRLDISWPEDLIEEVGRIAGFEKIPAIFPVAALVPPKRNEEVFWENIVKDILKEQGFTEVYNYSFVSEKGGVEVENPISSEYKYLRSELSTGLLKNTQKNLKNFPEVKIFELGKVFSTRSEKRMLGGAVSSEGFYYLKGIVDLLLHKLGISDIWYKEQGRKSAQIRANAINLGFLNERVFEIDFEKLQKLCSEEHEYRPLSKFPALVRDLAVLVPPRTKAAEVLNVINAAGGVLVRDVDLFDVYEGDELPGGKKNLAFHIIYQSDKKTLTSNEVEKIHQKIIKTLEKNPLWQVRK
jgi:phenylalanyl-tRNA synthetase beta chain